MADIFWSIVFIVIGGACLLALFYDPLTDTGWADDYPDDEEEEGR